MRYAYPLMLDVTERLVVIVGGGAVAVRKARGLLEAGARRVRVVAPRIDADMPAAVEHIDQPYAPGHLDGAFLVFAATDSPRVNEQVVRDARARGTLVNRADELEPAGDFTTPAQLRLGDVTVTVSAGGNPALAAAIRDDLSGRIDPRHVRMAQAMQILRPMILAGLEDPSRRRALFRDLAGPDAMAALDTGGEASLRQWIEQRYPELKL